jgi:hypothetical protein
MRRWACAAKSAVFSRRGSVQSLGKKGVLNAPDIHNRSAAFARQNGMKGGEKVSREITLFAFEHMEGGESITRLVNRHSA